MKIKKQEDFMGNELRVGDTVIYSLRREAYKLCTGVIVRLTNKGVVIKITERNAVEEYERDLSLLWYQIAKLK